MEGVHLGQPPTGGSALIGGGDPGGRGLERGLNDGVLVPTLADRPGDIPAALAAWEAAIRPEVERKQQLWPPRQRRLCPSEPARIVAEPAAAATGLPAAGPPIYDPALHKKLNP